MLSRRNTGHMREIGYPRLESKNRSESSRSTGMREVKARQHYHDQQRVREALSKIKKSDIIETKNEIIEFCKKKLRNYSITAEDAAPLEKTMKRIQEGFESIEKTLKTRECEETAKICLSMDKEHPERLIIEKTVDRLITQRTMNRSGDQYSNTPIQDPSHQYILTHNKGRESTPLDLSPDSNLTSLDSSSQGETQPKAGPSTRNTKKMQLNQPPSNTEVQDIPKRHQWKDQASGTKPLPLKTRTISELSSCNDPELPKRQRTQKHNNYTSHSISDPNPLSSSIRYRGDPIEPTQSRSNPNSDNNNEYRFTQTEKGKRHAKKSPDITHDADLARQLASSMQDNILSESTAPESSSTALIRNDSEQALQPAYTNLDESNQIPITDTKADKTVRRVNSHDGSIHEIENKHGAISKFVEKYNENRPQEQHINKVIVRKLLSGKIKKTKTTKDGKSLTLDPSDQPRAVRRVNSHNGSMHEIENKHGAISKFVEKYNEDRPQEQHINEVILGKLLLGKTKEAKTTKDGKSLTLDPSDPLSRPEDKTVRKVNSHDGSIHEIENKHGAISKFAENYNEGRPQEQHINPSILGDLLLGKTKEAKTTKDGKSLTLDPSDPNYK